MMVKFVCANVQLTVRKKKDSFSKKKKKKKLLKYGNENIDA